MNDIFSLDEAGFNFLQCLHSWILRITWFLAEANRPSLGCCMPCSFRLPNLSHNMDRMHRSLTHLCNTLPRWKESSDNQGRVAVQINVLVTRLCTDLYFFHTQIWWPGSNCFNSSRHLSIFIHFYTQINLFYTLGLEQWMQRTGY